MDETLLTNVWEAVHDRVGDDLRVVTRYEGHDYATRMREDIRSAYSATEDREVVDDAVVSQLTLDDTESAFKTGELHGVVRVFDDAWVVVWPDEVGHKSGFIVSIQRGESAASLAAVEWTIGYLDEEVAPRLE